MNFVQTIVRLPRRWRESRWAIFYRLAQLEKKVTTMAKNLQELTQETNAYLDQLDTHIEGVAGDVSWVKEQLEKIQNSPGTFSPADQQSVDAMQARIGRAVEKLAALNAMTEERPTEGGGEEESDAPPAPEARSQGRRH